MMFLSQKGFGPWVHYVLSSAMRVDLVGNMIRSQQNLHYSSQNLGKDAHSLIGFFLYRIILYASYLWRTALTDWSSFTLVYLP